jgi:hypothetical protein
MPKSQNSLDPRAISAPSDLNFSQLLLRQRAERFSSSRFSFIWAYCPSLLTRREKSGLNELKDFGLNLHESTPLWYYILKEAELMQNGLRLGPVGGRIVGEVIIGLLQLDRNSFMADEPHWRPTLPTRSDKVIGDCRMVDFLTLAGVGEMR